MLAQQSLGDKVSLVESAGPGNNLPVEKHIGIDGDGASDWTTPTKPAEPTGGKGLRADPTDCEG
jgi:hypothetical protein